MPDKYEKEIEEILRKLEVSKPQRKRESDIGARARGLLQRLRPSSPGHLMLYSFGLAIIAVVLQFALIDIGGLLGLVAGVGFLTAFFTSFVKPGGGYRRRWRDKVIELPKEELPLWEQFYYWLYGDQEKR